MSAYGKKTTAPPSPHLLIIGDYDQSKTLLLPEGRSQDLGPIVKSEILLPPQHFPVTLIFPQQEEKYWSLYQAYQRGAQGLILICDLSRKESLDYLTSYLKYRGPSSLANRSLHPQAPVYLLTVQSQANQVVTDEEIQRLRTRMDQSYASETKIVRYPHNERTQYNSQVLDRLIQELDHKKRNAPEIVERYEQVNQAKSRLSTLLTYYIHRIEKHKKANGSINFAAGLRFAFFTRSAVRREANYHLAKNLLAQLNQVVAAGADLETIKNIFAGAQKEQARWLKASNQTHFFTGIYSKDLQAVIFKGMHPGSSKQNVKASNEIDSINRSA